jgi:hypothetical protein
MEGVNREGRAMTSRRRNVLIAIGAVAVVGAGGAAVAGAVGGDDDHTDTAITGAALERASAAALAHVGGGEVTGTEAGDEEGAYEVEVTRPGGGQVDVHLDRDFRVLGTEDEAGDDEREDDGS